MITPAHSNLAFALTKLYFGETTAIVIRTLFSCDQASLRLLRVFLPKLKLNELKRSLLVLVKYQLVDYVKTVKNSNQQIEYSVAPSRVFAFFRVPRFILSAKEPQTSFISLTIFERAVIKRDDLIQLLTPQKDNPIQDRKPSDIIDELILKKNLVQTNQDLCINIEKLSRDNRDVFVSRTISRYYNSDNLIRRLVECILELAHDNTSDEASVTAPVPFSNIEEVLVPQTFPNRATLEKYLKSLSLESNNKFIITSGLHPNKGPMYAIDIGSTIDYLVREHLSSVITTRFGPKCCRVFRILLTRGPLLLKQIEELIMLPARDVREYSYMLIKEGFVRNRQVPKTLDNAPGKSLFIMSVNLQQVVSSITDLCCQSISNILTRYEHELNQHNALLERSNAVQELIKTNAKSDPSTAEDDWNQYFNSHELARLEWINRTLDKLLIAKNQVDETLTILHWWAVISPNMRTSDIV